MDPIILKTDDEHEFWKKAYLVAMHDQVAHSGMSPGCRADCAVSHYRMREAPALDNGDEPAFGDPPNCPGYWWRWSGAYPDGGRWVLERVWRSRRCGGLVFRYGKVQTAGKWGGYAKPPSREWR